MSEREVLFQEITAFELSSYTEKQELQKSYEISEEVKKIYRKYGRAELDVIKKYYLSAEEIGKIKNEVGKMSRSWANKYGLADATRMWRLRGGDDQMFRVVLMDFLLKGIIKTDKGIPRSKGFELKHLEPLKLSINRHIEQYNDSMKDALDDFERSMKDIKDRDLTLQKLKQVSPLGETIDALISDFKNSIGTTLVKVANFGIEFVPLGTYAKQGIKVAKGALDEWFGKKEELAKERMNEALTKKEDMTINLVDKITEFKSKFTQIIQDIKYSFIEFRDKILDNLTNEFNAAKGRHQQQIKDGVIFSLRTLDILTDDLRSKNTEFFKFLYCATWINNVYDTEPDTELMPPVITFMQNGQKIPIPNKIQPGHLKITIGTWNGNQVNFPSRLKGKSGTIVATGVATEIRALGARQIKVILSALLDENKPKWFMKTVWNLPVRKTIYFSEYDTRNVSKESIHNYILLDKQNNIVDIHYEDPQLVKFVYGILDPIVTNYIKATGGFKDYMDKKPDLKIKLSSYWGSHLNRIVYPE